jgi:Zn-dependent protease with chaperone function
MIFGHWGLSLNILAIGVLSFCVSILLVALVAALSNDLSTRFEAKSRLRILWCGVALPWLVSISSIGLLIFPELFQLPTTWLTSFVHWHHVYHFPIYSWHGATLILSSSVFCFLFLSKLLKALRTNTQLDKLEYFVTKSRLPDGCFLIESHQLKAFTSGFFHPRSYITTGLRDQLTQQETEVVQQHELAHLKKADPLRKYFFALFASFFPDAIQRYLVETFSLALEQLADDTVLQKINDNTLISKTILKVVRLSKDNNNLHRSPPTHCHFASHPLELRIRYLLSDDKGESFPLILFILFTSLMITISTLSVDLLHHGVEYLLNY